MARIRGALFDKDGTLIDFAATWRGLVRGMIAEYAKGDEKLALALGDAIGFDGRTGAFLPGSPVVADSTDVFADLMAQLLPGVPAAVIEKDANERARAASSNGSLAPVPGLADTVRRLTAMEITLGVATHDGEAAARAHALALGVSEDFSFFAGYDSGHGLKPSSGMPLAFCAATGLRPEEIVMVGDSIHDLGAGRAAGAGVVVAVLTGPAEEAELAPHADVVLPSIVDLPDFLRRRLNPT